MKSKAKYLIRLDDACETFSIEKWQKYFDLFDKYNVKPIIAVIPDNKSQEFLNHPQIPDFWKLVKEWEKKCWCIAMHGHEHLYLSKNSGMLNTMPKVSEFAGIPYDRQIEKLRKAKEIFNKNGLNPTVFVAPSHTLDHNTLKALKEATDITTISDGFALKPYLAYGFKWIPMQSWSFRSRPFGLWTICLHPEVGDINEINSLDCFLANNKDRVTTIDALSYGNLRIKDYLFRYLLSAKRLIIKRIKGHY